METKDKIVPLVGMGCTKVSGSDRYPFTIIEVSASGKAIRVQADRAIRGDRNGQSEAQDYVYEPDPQGEIIEVSLRKDGRWKRVGTDWDVFIVGYRRQYLDPSF